MGRCRRETAFSEGPIAASATGSCSLRHEQPQATGISKRDERAWLLKEKGQRHCRIPIMPRVAIDQTSPSRATLGVEIARLRRLDAGELQARWHTVIRRRPPSHLPRHLLLRVLAYQLQADLLGDLTAGVVSLLKRSSSSAAAEKLAAEFNQCKTTLKVGTVLVREWNRRLHRVTARADGFEWNNKIYPSLSKVARAITGTRWNGPRFFGLRDKSSKGVRP